MADEDHVFEGADSGASATFPMQAGQIRKGGYVVMKARPCKVVEVTTSKTGKHGHAKAHIVGIDIFTNKKIEDLCPTSHNMDVPNVKRSEYSLMDMDGEFASLLDDAGTVKSDLKLPEGELGADIRAAHEAGKEVTVAVISAMGEEAILGFKAA
jgi:translation initiation factor 5A